jgi:hypothetical protein
MKALRFHNQKTSLNNNKKTYKNLYEIILCVSVFIVCTAMYRVHLNTISLGYNRLVNNGQPVTLINLL